MKASFETVTDVVNHNLCCSCGTCVGVCPNGALSLTENRSGIYVPTLNESKCSECNLCIKVCPGYSVDFGKLNRSVFNTTPKNSLVGEVVASYLGYSLDDTTREHSQSGGLVSSLLSFILEKRIIDGAIVTRMRQSDPLRPQTYIARTKDDILEAAKSKYCPVPTNSIIREVMNTEGRFAFVGTSCQMQGIRKAESLNQKLKEKIVLHLGLFCDRILNFYYQEYVLSKAKINSEIVNRFVYKRKMRHGIDIQLKSGEVVNLRRDYFWDKIKPFFTVQRCLLCFDKLNQLADISFGDAWLPEVINDEKGLSVVISRNKWADKLLVDAINEGAIYCGSIPLSKIVEGQGIRKKKNMVEKYLVAAHSLGDGVPQYNPGTADKQVVSRREMFFAFMDILTCKVFTLSLFRRFFVHIPMPLLRRLLNLKFKVIRRILG